jgi:hypothetical protein
MPDTIPRQESAESGLSRHALFGLADLRALRELMPPKRGELLRVWMLRCTCQGLVKKEEALRIKADNHEAWNAVYIIEPNTKLGNG